MKSQFTWKARHAVGASVARPATKEPIPTSTRMPQTATSVPGSSRGLRLQDGIDAAHWAIPFCWVM